MSAGPNGPGPQRPGSQGKRKEIKTPAWLDSSGNTPPSRPYMAPSRYSGGTAAKGTSRPADDALAMARRLFSIRYVRLGLIAVVVATLGLGSWSYFYGPPTSCRRSAARKSAVKVLVETQDAVTGDPLSERFARGDFRCANLAATDFAPGGVLVETHDGEDPVTWFFDESGKAYNVNQLAAAWTPAFPASPRITTEQLAVLRD